MTRATLDLNRAVEYLDRSTDYKFDQVTDYQILADLAGAIFGCQHWASMTLEDYAQALAATAA